MSCSLSPVPRPAKVPAIVVAQSPHSAGIVVRSPQGGYLAGLRNAQGLFLATVDGYPVRRTARKAARLARVIFSNR